MGSTSYPKDPEGILSMLKQQRMKRSPLYKTLIGEEIFKPKDKGWQPETGRQISQESIKIHIFPDLEDMEKLPSN